MTLKASALAPVDPQAAEKAEQEKTSPWVVRKLATSVTGRVVMSAYESLRATGTEVVCLSPWGDSSPLILPCIRFRDLVIETVMVGTGGTAAIAAPVMDPISGVVADSLGDSIIVELATQYGQDAITGVTDDYFIEGPIEKLAGDHEKILETTGVKTLTITINFKHTMSDARLGFYRSAVHNDSSLFANVKDYLATQKGWFSPYLFASSRRPIIPRTMTPDIIFCHGPFLSGDYKIGQALLDQSASSIRFCPDPQGREGDADAVAGADPTKSRGKAGKAVKKLFKRSKKKDAAANADDGANAAEETTDGTDTDGTNTDGEEEQGLAAASPDPRRLMLTLVGLKPMRPKLGWTSSQRPDESVMQYQLTNAAHALVLPAILGAPLLAWDALNLRQIWELSSEQVDAHASALFEFVDMSVDWERVQIPEGVKGDTRDAVKGAVKGLVATAVKTGESKEVKKEMDETRAGIVMFRIP